MAGGSAHSSEREGKDVSKLRAEWGALTQNATSFQQDLLTRLEEACRERDEARAQLRKLIDFVTSQPHLLGASPTSEASGAQQTTPFAAKVPNPLHASPSQSSQPSATPSAFSPRPDAAACAESVPPPARSRDLSPAADAPQATEAAPPPPAVQETGAPGAVQQRTAIGSRGAQQAEVAHAAPPGHLLSSKASSDTRSHSHSYGAHLDDTARHRGAVAVEAEDGPMSMNMWPPGHTPEPSESSLGGSKHPSTAGGSGSSKQPAPPGHAVVGAAAKHAGRISSAADHSRTVPRLQLEDGAASQPAAAPRARRASAGAPAHATRAQDSTTLQFRAQMAPQADRHVLSPRLEAGDEAPPPGAAFDAPTPALSPSAPLLSATAAAAADEDDDDADIPVADEAARYGPASARGEGPWRWHEARATLAPAAAALAASVHSTLTDDASPAVEESAAAAFYCPGGYGLGRPQTEYPPERGYKVQTNRHAAAAAQHGRATWRCDMSPEPRGGADKAEALDGAKGGGEIQPREAQAAPVVAGDAALPPQPAPATARLSSSSSAPQLYAGDDAGGGVAVAPVATMPPTGAVTARARLVAAPTPVATRRTMQHNAETYVSVPARPTLASVSSSGLSSTEPSVGAVADGAAPPRAAARTHPPVATRADITTQTTDSVASDGARVPAAAEAAPAADATAAAGDAAADSGGLEAADEDGVSALPVDTSALVATDTSSFGADVQAQLTVRDLQRGAHGAAAETGDEPAISLQPPAAEGERYRSISETAVATGDHDAGASAISAAVSVIVPAPTLSAPLFGSEAPFGDAAHATPTNPLRTAQQLMRADWSRDGAHRYSPAARALYGMSVTPPGPLSNTSSQGPSTGSTVTGRRRDGGGGGGGRIANETLRQTASEAPRPRLSVASSVTTAAPPPARVSRGSRRRRQGPRARSAPAQHAERTPSSQQQPLIGEASPGGDGVAVSHASAAPLLAADASTAAFDGAYASDATPYVPPHAEDWRATTSPLYAAAPARGSSLPPVAEPALLHTPVATHEHPSHLTIITGRHSDVGDSRPALTLPVQPTYARSQPAAQARTGALHAPERASWRNRRSVKSSNAVVVTGVRGEQDALVEALMKPMRADQGRPTAALVIFRCLLRWEAISALRAEVLDKIATTAHLRIEPVSRRALISHADTATLSYWVANVFTLLLLLLRNVAFAPAHGGTVRHAAQLQRIKTSVQQSHQLLRTLSRKTFRRRESTPDDAARHGTYARRASDGAELVAMPPARHKLTAGAAANGFKRQLEACLAKALPLLRDGVKRSIARTLSACVTDTLRAPPPRFRTMIATQPRQPWRDLITTLEGVRTDVCTACVPGALQRLLFEQLLTFANATLFNRLLAAREHVTLVAGEQLKHGLLQLDQWLFDAGEGSVGGAAARMRPFREAVAFLCLPDKPARSLRHLQNDTCPHLGAPQLYRLASWFHDEKYGTTTVSRAVLGEMHNAIAEQTRSIAPTSYLIPDATKGPLAPDFADFDDGAELYAGVAVPEALRRYVDKRHREVFAFVEAPLLMGGAQ